MTDVTECVTIHCRMAKNPAPVCYLICLYFIVLLGTHDFFNLLLNPFLPSTSLPTTTTTSFSYSFLSFFLSLSFIPTFLCARFLCPFSYITAFFLCLFQKVYTNLILSNDYCFEVQVLYCSFIVHLLSFL